MSGEGHETDIGSDHYGTQFIARCSCGWLGNRQVSRGAAENEADDHVVAAIGH